MPIHNSLGALGKKEALKNFLLREIDILEAAFGNIRKMRGPVFCLPRTTRSSAVWRTPSARPTWP